MILETTQHLHLPTQLPFPAALRFVQRPDLVLSELDFLKTLEYQPEATEATVSGVLALPVPMMGEVTLPFLSHIVNEPEGAALLSQPLAKERAWLAIAGQGQCQEAADKTLWLEYHFQFQAHVQLPESEQWGSKAFEKMVQATAQRSIARVAERLPIAFEKALQHAEMAQVGSTLP